jgi:hypothetical protein
MSYKYHERAIVINERNLVRLWDVGYDGYVGGKGEDWVDWNDQHDLDKFREATSDVTKPYQGKSMMVMAFIHDNQHHIKSNWPSPLVFHHTPTSPHMPNLSRQGNHIPLDSENIRVVNTTEFEVFSNAEYSTAYTLYRNRMPDFSMLHRIRKNAGQATVENEAVVDSIAFQGSMKMMSTDNAAVIKDIQGSGHHGPDFVGVASLRSGKGYKINTQPTLQRLI